MKMYIYYANEGLNFTKQVIIAENDAQAKAYVYNLIRRARANGESTQFTGPMEFNAAFMMDCLAPKNISNKKYRLTKFECEIEERPWGEM
jgi:hypothetical protein